jgi:hypothetical protein
MIKAIKPVKAWGVLMDWESGPFLGHWAQPSRHEAAADAQKHCVGAKAVRVEIRVIAPKKKVKK